MNGSTIVGNDLKIAKVNPDLMNSNWIGDAQLIASAPEMLETLINAESILFHINADGGIDTPIDQAELVKVLNEVRSIINKAKGGE